MTLNFRQNLASVLHLVHSNLNLFCRVPGQSAEAVMNISQLDTVKQPDQPNAAFQHQLPEKRHVRTLLQETAAKRNINFSTFHRRDRKSTRLNSSHQLT